MLKNKKLYYAIIAIVNVVLITAAVLVLWFYTAARVHDEQVNVEEAFTAENTGTAEQLQTFVVAQFNQLIGNKVYIENNLSLEEAMRYLKDSNVDERLTYQILQTEATTVSGQTDKFYCGKHIDIAVGDIVDYAVNENVRAVASLISLIGQGLTEDSYLNVSAAYVAQIRESQPNCISFYTPLLLENVTYAFLCTVEISDVAPTAFVNSSFEATQNILVDKNGDYIIKEGDSGENNLFNYLESIDAPSELSNEIRSDIRGKAYITNEDNQNCLLVFYKLTDTDGCVYLSVVPIDSVDLSTIDFTFMAIMLAFIIVIVVFNCGILVMLNRQLKTNIAKTNEAMETAEKANVAKTKFLSTMSHEIRTPLNAIIGLTALTIDSLENKAQAIDYLQKTEYSSKLLLSLINDILDMSAIESQKMKINVTQFDIKQLLTSLSAVYYDQSANKGIDFETVVSNTYTEILEGDALRLNQILINLLSNAVKFTPKGGRIVFKIKLISSDETRETLRFEVSDTGVGMSEDMKKRLFRPFEQESGRTTQKYGGTGLGLSIAKSLTEMMGGRISVESEKGKGSTFAVEIPFTIPKSKSPNRTESVENLRVLVVDDDIDTLNYVGTILKNLGLRFDLAVGGQKAVELFKTSQEEDLPYDICLIDWRMPEMDGLEVTRILREELKATSQIIIVSAYDTRYIIDESKKIGADLVVAKPLFPSTLYNLFVEISKGRLVIKSESDEPFNFTGKKILLVEDNALNSEIATKQLTKVGFLVETAANGKEGFEKFNRSQYGKYDAVLMDIQMPIMNGYEAAAAIRNSSHPQSQIIPIVAMTADAFAEDIVKSAEAGMNAHISKPIEVKRLLKTLSEFLL